MYQKIFFRPEDVKTLREGHDLTLAKACDHCQHIVEFPIGWDGGNGHRRAAPTTDNGHEPPTTKGQRRQFTDEFKRKVVAEVAAGKPVSEVAAKYDVHRSVIDTWRRNAKLPAKPRGGQNQKLTDEQIAKLVAETDVYVKDGLPFEPTLTKKYGVALKTIYGYRYKRDKKK